MSSFSPAKSEQFYFAARGGNLALFRSLAVDPEVDLHWIFDDRYTALDIIGLYGRTDLIRFLLDEFTERPIDLNQRGRSGSTPFFHACSRNHLNLVEFLLADQRIDVNLANDQEQTPLWEASDEGHLRVVQLMLVSGRMIDVAKVDLVSRKKAAEIARMKGGRTERYPGESEEGFQNKIKKYQAIAALIEAFELDPQAVRSQLIRDLGLNRPFSGELFALVVFLSDGYLQISWDPKQNLSNPKRFLRLSAQLPLDLQMVLCNRTFGLGDAIIKKSDSERGFIKIAKSFR